MCILLNILRPYIILKCDFIQSICMIFFLQGTTIVKCVKMIQKITIKRIEKLYFSLKMSENIS